MSEEEPANLVPETFSSFLDSIPKVVTNSAVPIIIRRGQALHVYGTANLLRLGDQLYAFTAAHVIDDAKAGGNELFYYTPTELIPLGDVVRGTEPADGPLDIAVLQLKGTAHRLLDFAHPMEGTNLGCVDLPPALGYYVAGYPFVASTPGIVDGSLPWPVQLPILTFEYGGVTAGLDNYSAKHHILLSARLSDFLDRNGQAARFLAYTGYQADFPGDLGGISGAAVWAIIPSGTEEEPTLLPMVVGVETAVYRTRSLIRATRIRELTGRLARWFPDQFASAAKMLESILRDFADNPQMDADAFRDLVLSTIKAGAKKV